ncbi:MAG: PepSY domain-containing protein [Leptotrichiaceae bacterium]|nr:PepSY domain-containing protein [Leptotrichiaceae bacterium]
MRNKFFKNNFLVILIFSIFFLADKKIFSENKDYKLIKVANVKISIEEAKVIVFRHSKISHEKAKITKIKIDKENRKRIYKIEFFSGDKKYIYSVDADTGKILSYSQKNREIAGKKTETENIEIIPVKESEEKDRKNENALKYIGENKVREIIAERITGAKKSDIVKLHLARKNEKTVYIGKMEYENTEYEFIVDAFTGEILSWKVDEK